MAPKAGDDTGLVASMAKRLKTLEVEASAQRQQAQRKEEVVAKLRRENEELRRELAELREERAAGPPDPAHAPPHQPGADVYQELERQRKENARQRHQAQLAWQQVAEMKAFLNDYGMVWIGQREGDAGAGPSAKSVAAAAADPLVEPRAAADTRESGCDAPAAELRGAPKKAAPAAAAGPSSSTGTDFTVDMEQLRESIAELNAVAGDGRSTVVVGPNGERKLQANQSLDLAVYADGFRLADWPFRPYSQKEAQSFMRDVLDGYFPYELKDKYPDGVPFKLHDFSAQTFESPEGQSFKPFSGVGQSMGNVHQLHSQREPPRGPRDGQSFLNKLPAQVIRNGRLIDVRSEVADYLGKGAPAAPDVALVETPMSNLLGRPNPPGRRASLGGNSPDAGLAPVPEASRGAEDGASKVTTLRVRDEDGNKTYMLKMAWTDTVGDLRRCIDSHRGLQTPYEIRTNFPVRAFNDPKETLEDAQLVPSAAVFLRALAGRRWVCGRKEESVSSGAVGL